MKKSKISKMVYLWESENGNVKYISPYHPDGRSVDFISIFTRRVDDFLQDKSFEEIEKYYLAQAIHEDYIFVYET